MLGLLGLGVCIACISCCLCTATVIAVPDLIHFPKSSIFFKKRKHNETKRKSEHTFCPEVKKISFVCDKETSEGTESETCPCTMTWDLVPIFKNSRGVCRDIPTRRKYCECPSFSELIDNLPNCPAKLLPRG